MLSRRGATARQTFSGMVSAVDEAVSNVTAALEGAGMWATSLFVWTTDNGSPVQVGGSNHPLRSARPPAPRPCPPASSSPRPHPRLVRREALS